MKLPQPLLGEVGVLALVPDQWCEQWQPRHHVLIRLANYFQVVWMNCPPGWRECLSSATHRFTSTEPPPRSAALEIYQPVFWLPNLGRPVWLATLTSRQRLKRACDLLHARGCTRLVLYIWRPEFAAAFGQVR